MSKRTFLEFFAGGGMARIGLGRSWRCVLANDFDPGKCSAYRANFGDAHLHECGVEALRDDDFPATPVDLAWASFPCQDLSLAGPRDGLNGSRSGTFYAYWEHMERLIARDARPRTLVIENVAGLLSSNAGKDFRALIACLASAGYLVSARIIDAAAFLPQSRPRLFIFAFFEPPDHVFSDAPVLDIETRALAARVRELPEALQKKWRWLAAPPARTRRRRALADLIDLANEGWFSKRDTEKLIAMLSDAQKPKLKMLQSDGGLHIGAAFRRTRMVENERRQRLEARFDGLAGCLRTPAGGSSRQLLIAIDKGAVRMRLFTPREAARLMGLPDAYQLPQVETHALKLCGDGVCPPVVRWIAHNILEPALDGETFADAA